VKGNGQYEKVSNAVMQLKAMAKAAKVVVFSPSQVNRSAVEGKPIDLDDARDSGAIEETADFMFSIFRPDEALNPSGEDKTLQPSGTLRLTLLKSRHGGKDRVISLKFDMLHLSVVEEKDPLARRVSDDNNLAWRGWKYEDLRKQETRPLQSSMFGTTRKDLNS
jgi:replicative DNA helicase